MQLELIVFDWDGTLMDSTAHIVRSIQRACEATGLPVPERAVASHVIGLALPRALATACPGQSNEAYRALEDAYRRAYLTGEETIELFDGVADALARWKARGTLLAVATGKSRRGLDRALAATGLAGLFDATRTVDECASKPHPQMLAEITSDLGVDAARTVMVGDTSHDLLMAANAGTHALGVSYGAHPVDTLAACQPAAIFDDFSALDAWLTPRLC
ncbi:HAD-IA family hydrolase [Crenobacter intestini]|uniref:HAD family hydrolase n=1 Tax=Crenobacter intestini TaxID=2563443 RepID=A0A4T0UW47_9NEIS|nr:HAD-IA family hydrolase [Crenobacter intestini]TIC83077.1 HAD family hydrolase [Crenobacter intestini]